MRKILCANWIKERQTVFKMVSISYQGHRYWAQKKLLLVRAPSAIRNTKKNFLKKCTNIQDRYWYNLYSLWHTNYDLQISIMLHNMMLHYFANCKVCFGFTLFIYLVWIYSVRVIVRSTFFNFLSDPHSRGVGRIFSTMRLHVCITTIYTCICM